MKNHDQEKNVWKDEMIRRWENLVLMYQRIRESPQIRLAAKFFLELLKILLRILARKVLETLFDEV